MDNKAKQRQQQSGHRWSYRPTAAGSLLVTKTFPEIAAVVVEAAAVGQVERVHFALHESGQHQIFAGFHDQLAGLLVDDSCRRRHRCCRR